VPKTEAGTEARVKSNMKFGQQDQHYMVVIESAESEFLHSPLSSLNLIVSDMIEKKMTDVIFTFKNIPSADVVNQLFLFNKFYRDKTNRIPKISVKGIDTIFITILKRMELNITALI